MNLLSIVTPWLDNVCQIKTKCYSSKNKKILRTKQGLNLFTTSSDAFIYHQCEYSFFLEQWHALSAYMDLKFGTFSRSQQIILSRTIVFAYDMTRCSYGPDTYAPASAFLKEWFRRACIHWCLPNVHGRLIRQHMGIAPDGPIDTPLLVRTTCASLSSVASCCSRLLARRQRSLETFDKT